MSDPLDETRLTTVVSRHSGYCRHCGTPVNQGARFCAACGAEVQTNYRPRRSAPAALPFVLLIVAFALGFPSGVAAYRLAHHQNVLGPPPPEATHNLDAAQTVSRFYEDLNRHDFNQAYSLLSLSRRELAPFSTWKSGFDSTIAQHANVSPSGRNTYAVDLTAVDRMPDGQLTTTYAGSWTVKEDARKWHLDTPAFSKVTSTYFADAKAGDVASTYAKLKHSLAFVANDRSEGIAMGTAFCIASNATTAYFLTNHHVIGDEGEIKVVLFDKPKTVLDGRVVKIAPDPLDAAIIEVNAGALPVLRLANDLPSEGRAVALAGYPAIQIELALHQLVSSHRCTRAQSTLCLTTAM